MKIIPVLIYIYHLFTTLSLRFKRYYGSSINFAIGIPMGNVKLVNCGAEARRPKTEDRIILW